MVGRKINRKKTAAAALSGIASQLLRSGRYEGESKGHTVITLQFLSNFNKIVFLIVMTEAR